MGKPRKQTPAKAVHDEIVTIETDDVDDRFFGIVLSIEPKRRRKPKAVQLPQPALEYTPKPEPFTWCG